MENFCLSPEEVQELAYILDDRLLELRAELYHTERYDYKEKLLREKDLVRTLLIKIELFAAQQVQTARG